MGRREAGIGSRSMRGPRGVLKKKENAALAEQETKGPCQKTEPTPSKQVQPSPSSLQPGFFFRFFHVFQNSVLP